MPRVRLSIAMSIDGFVAGPQQSVEHPLGIGGMQLHAWAFALASWRKPHGLEGGEVNASSAVVDELLDGVGATVMGRNMFGGHPGPWKADAPWSGWWGDSPPFHHPVFVVTHFAREPLALAGGTTFTFVTEGVTAAVAQAKQAAQGKIVSLAGGAAVARQALLGGQVDEMVIHLVPVLLGAGERLFEGVPDLQGLTLTRTVAAPKAAHLFFRARV